MTLSNTAIASLALPSAVSVALRVQSQWSQACASFGNKWPQYGHAIWSGPISVAGGAGASVYSIERNQRPKQRLIRQATSRVMSWGAHASRVHFSAPRRKEIE